MENIMYSNNGHAFMVNSHLVGFVDKYNPLNLPPYTIRLRYAEGITPTFSKGTGVQVSQSPNVWDLTYENSDWSSLLVSNTSLLEILGANTTDVTNMYNMCFWCTSLNNVSLFDTSNVTNMSCMFKNCHALTTIPLLNTSNVTDMGGMFQDSYNITNIPLLDTSIVVNMESMLARCSRLTIVPLLNTSNVTNMNNMLIGCKRVETGALALYQQSSSQSTPPTNHSGTFRYCGSNTETGAAELAQIPSDWK